MKKYDVIIAGASFAGLAVASKITKSNVLLIDNEEIGSHQRSACGTTVEIVKAVGCEKSIIKTFDIATLHTKNKEIDIHLPEPFCTIDYKKFCKILAKKNNTKFLKSTVKGIKDSTVITTKGNFKADIIIDCTGWQAVLASSLKKDYVKKNMLSFGIETEIPYKDDKLRFFVNPSIIKNGAAWLFPCKNTVRFGIGSYKGDTRILQNLKDFIKIYNLRIGKIHGGYFGYHFKKEPVIGNIFVVGEAAGQTLPLTGEGIRRSIYFGLSCGEIIQKILSNKISFEEGKRKYTELALRSRRLYKLLLRAQNKLPILPNFKLNLITQIFGIKVITYLGWKIYKSI